MALPSSPPLFGEEPPSSPPALPTLSSSSSLSGAGSRKRQLSDYGSLSSDPLFSELSSDAEFSEDAGQPRRKKLVRGPWWKLSAGKRAGRSLRQSMAKQHGGMRNADSGVWMGSDDSLDNLTLPSSRLEHLQMSDNHPNPRDTEEEDEDMERRIAEAARRVAHVLENGKETVDLSGLGLSNIPGDVLQPLNQLIRTPFADMTHPPSEDEFTSLTPSIQLFLYSNRLAALPHELYDLENITVLSLRGNDLKQLPSHISRLHRLKELNVAGNQLRHLPWEVLGILRAVEDSSKIRLRPNPFITINLKPVPDTLSLQSNSADRGEATNLNLPDILRNNLALGRQAIARNTISIDVSPPPQTSTHDQLIFLAPAKIQYLNSQGKPLRSHPSLGTFKPADLEIPCLDAQNPPPNRRATAPPSLFELSLRQIQHTYTAQQIRTPDPDWNLAPLAHLGLEKAAKGREEGNEVCSTCGREYVIARAEWIEFWFHGDSTRALTEDCVLPVMRKSCSWACAEPTSVGTGYEL